MPAHNTAVFVNACLCTYMLGLGNTSGDPSPGAFWVYVCEPTQRYSLDANTGLCDYLCMLSIY